MGIFNPPSFTNPVFVGNVTMGASSQLQTLSGDLLIQPAGNLDLGSAGGPQWQIDGTGRIKPVSDNGTDIGTTGVNRVRNIFAGTAINCDGTYKVSGTQVLAAQITGYGTPTGGSHQASFAAGSITLANLAAVVAQLIVDLKTHGMLGA